MSTTTKYNHEFDSGNYNINGQSFQFSFAVIEDFTSGGIETIHNFLKFDDRYGREKFDSNTKFQISSSITFSYFKFGTIWYFSNFLVHISKTTVKYHPYTLTVTSISSF